MKKIKVLHLTSTPKGLGGAEKLLIDMADKYDTSRFEVEHCNIYSESPYGDTYEKLLREKRAKVRSITGKGYFDLPPIVRQLRNIVISGGFDVLHAQMLHATIIGAAVSKTIRNLRFVVTKQYTDDHIAKRKMLFFLDRIATRRADRVLAISRAVRSEQINHGISTDRIVMAPNAVDTTPFNIKRDSDTSLDNRPLNIVTIGNLHKRKGHKFLVDAFAPVLRSSDKVVLSIAGEGPERDSILKQIQQLGIEGKVRLLGYVGDIPSLLATSDIYVHPSESEPFGIAIIEAMASKLCVIATNVGGVSDIIENNVNGILIRYGDEKGFRESLQRVITENHLREKLARQARETVLNNFSISGTVSIYQKVYSDLTANAIGNG